MCAEKNMSGQKRPKIAQRKKRNEKCADIKLTDENIVGYGYQYLWMKKNTMAKMFVQKT